MMARVCVVGVGYWGKNLARTAADVGALTAVCDSDPKTLAAVAQRYPGIKAYSSLDQALDDAEIAGFIIAVQPAAQYEAVKRVLLSGRHVMVEKPFTAVPRHAEELVELAAERRLVLMVGFTFLFNAAVETVKTYLDAGEIGEVYYVLSQRLNLGRVRSDVNAWWNLAPHDVSILHYWFASVPVEVSGWGASYVQPGIEDVAFGRLYFEDGRMGLIHVSWLDPNKTRCATVVGSQKMIVYNDVSSDRKVEVFDHGIDRRQPTGSTLGNFDNFGQFQLIQRAGDIHVPKIDFEEPLKREIRHFVECIDEGKPCRTGGRMALDVLRVLDAIDQSMHQGGRAVSVAREVRT